MTVLGKRKHRDPAKENGFWTINKVNQSSLWEKQLSTFSTSRRSADPLSSTGETPTRPCSSTGETPTRLLADPLFLTDETPTRPLSSTGKTSVRLLAKPPSSTGETPTRPLFSTGETPTRLSVLQGTINYGAQYSVPDAQVTVGNTISSTNSVTRNSVSDITSVSHGTISVIRNSVSDITAVSHGTISGTKDSDITQLYTDGSNTGRSIDLPVSPQNFSHNGPFTPPGHHSGLGSDSQSNLNSTSLSHLSLSEKRQVSLATTNADFAHSLPASMCNLSAQQQFQPSLPSPPQPSASQPCQRSLPLPRSLSESPEKLQISLSESLPSPRSLSESPEKLQVSLSESLPSPRSLSESPEKLQVSLSESSGSDHECPPGWMVSYLPESSVVSKERAYQHDDDDQLAQNASESTTGFESSSINVESTTGFESSSIGVESHTGFESSSIRIENNTRVDLDAVSTRSEPSAESTSAELESLIEDDEWEMIHNLFLLHQSKDQKEMPEAFPENNPPVEEALKAIKSSQKERIKSTIQSPFFEILQKEKDSLSQCKDHPQFSERVNDLFLKAMAKVLSELTANDKETAKKFGFLLHFDINQEFGDSPDYSPPAEDQTQQYMEHLIKLLNQPKYRETVIQVLFAYNKTTAVVASWLTIMEHEALVFLGICLGFIHPYYRKNGHVALWTFTPLRLLKYYCIGQARRLGKENRKEVFKIAKPYLVDLSTGDTLGVKGRSGKLALTYAKSHGIVSIQVEEGNKHIQIHHLILLCLDQEYTQSKANLWACHRGYVTGTNSSSPKFQRPSTHCGEVKEVPEAPLAGACKTDGDHMLGYAYNSVWTVWRCNHQVNQWLHLIRQQCNSWCHPLYEQAYHEEQSKRSYPDFFSDSDLPLSLCQQVHGKDCYDSILTRRTTKPRTTKPRTTKPKMCKDCTVVPRMPGWSLCNPCWKKNSAKKESKKKAAAMCKDCNVVAQVPGSGNLYCLGCKEKHDAMKKAAAMTTKPKMCKDCTVVPRMPGCSLCKPCWDEFQAKKESKKKAAAMCKDCTVVPRMPGWSLCNPCWKKNSAINT